MSRKSETVQVWLTPAQVAQRLGYKETTLRNWRYLGKGPLFHRVRRDDSSRPVIRYAEADVTAWQGRSMPMRSTVEAA